MANAGQFKKGQSGNPSGIWREKPFREALRIEALAAERGEASVAHKGSLRWNARKLLDMGEPTAIREVADRLDGKPAQEQHVTVDDKRDAPDWARGELVALIDDAAPRGNGTAAENGRGGKPDQVH